MKSYNPGFLFSKILLNYAFDDDNNKKFMGEIDRFDLSLDPAGNEPIRKMKTIHLHDSVGIKPPSPHVKLMEL